MKTLYVSDLDGTLLRSDETISEFTAQTINALVENGMLFSYATARSFHSAPKVTKGLTARLPLIVYNGSLIVDSATGQLLHGSFFGEDVQDLLADLIGHSIYPIVYAFIDGVEKYSHVPGKASRGMKQLNASRSGDVREIRLDDAEGLFLGQKFAITCIDEPEKLVPMYEKYKTNYHCMLYRDIYTNEQWLEIIPLGVSKASAIQKLKDMLGCDRLVVFGDGINDREMFRMADEAYAMDNAVGDLKALATGVIGSNNDDAVAKWLIEHYTQTLKELLID